MRQASEAGALFEELLIANYDLVAQAEENKSSLFAETEQLSLFNHLNYDYLEETKNDF